MVSASRPEVAGQQGVDLQPGPHWGSFEQFRVNGVDGLLNALQEDQVGTLDVKNREFALLQASAFQRLLGLARDADRLSHSLHALLQAVALLRETGGSQAALDHVFELTDLFAPLASPPPARSRELIFDVDEQSGVPIEELDFELDPAKIPRPQWTRG
jgi:hypothetical protein